MLGGTGLTFSDLLHTGLFYKITWVKVSSPDEDRIMIPFVWEEEDIEEIITWAELILVTGTTVVNGTIERFLDRDRPVVFYGVTIAGPARVLNLNRFCVKGH